MYSRYCSEKEKGNTSKDYKCEKNFKELLAHLNKYYTAITKVTDEVPNEFGEYKYPEIKTIFRDSNINNQSILNIFSEEELKLKCFIKYQSFFTRENIETFICLNSSDMTQEVEVGDSLTLLPLFKMGTIQNDRQLTDFWVESKVGDIVSVFKNNYSSLKGLINYSSIEPFIENISCFPSEAISVFYLDAMYSFEDIDACFK